MGTQIPIPEKSNKDALLFASKIKHVAGERVTKVQSAEGVTARRAVAYALGMSKLALLLAALFTSCSGLKVHKGGISPEPTAKPGITWGEGGIGKVQVQKVGFWCDVRGKILTFGAFGETEAKALDGATANCRKVHANGPCEKVACKPAS